MLRIVFAICVFVAQSFSQTGVLTGTVKDSQTLEPLAGANVALLGTTRGAATSADGRFVIHEIPAAEYIVRVSFIGYADAEMHITLGDGDSLFIQLLLQPEEFEVDEVVVTATRTVRNIADVPVRVEAVPQEEVEEKLLMTPSNVAMLLNESTGMRVQTTSATSNTANLRIQGLSGRYTQILTDGIPNFGGLAAGFGLMQMLPLHLRQVEIIKGASSVLYGADAISGVVNFITKDPKPQPELNALINLTTQKGFDLSGFYARQVGDIGLTLMASHNTQSLFDVDGDSFGDIAQFTRYSLSPKLIFSLFNDLRLRATFGIMSEDRLGGTLHTDSQPANLAYKEEIKTRRFDMTTQFDWTLSQQQSVTVKFAGMRLQRNALYGGSPFDAIQNILYTEAQYSQSVGIHDLLLGAAFTAEEFDDKTPLVGSLRGYNFSASGVFIQDELALAERWTLLLSGRMDIHNTFGTFFTPRVSLLFKPANMVTVRVGTGAGFKAPTIFVEEAEQAGFRSLRPLQNVRAEQARSGSFDIHWRAVFGNLAATFNFALYATQLSHGLLVNEDSLQNNVIVLQNTTGATLARGGEFTAKLSIGDVMLSTGYTYLYATQEHSGRTYELTLNPRHSFGAVLIWESDEAQMKIGLEQYWTGSQRLERNPYRSSSPDYWITGMIIEKGLGNIRLFINFENIFDARQTRYDPVVFDDLQLGVKRTVPVYAPLEGRVINGGIRFIL